METSPSWEAMYSDEKYRWFWPPAYDPVSTPAELDHVLSLLEARPHGRILDLACGLGWLTIPLAQHGLQVTGLDFSEALLSRAEQAAQQAGVDIEWIRGDMRYLPSDWSQRFDYVTLTLSEFGCFSEESDNQKVLHEIARVLKNNGRFLLDVVTNRDGLVQQENTLNTLEGDGFIVAEQGSLDLLSGIHTRMYHWYEQGRRHTTTWQIRAYTPPEVSHMLTEAGLHIVNLFGNLGGDKLTRTSMGMVFVAQK